MGGEDWVVVAMVAIAGAVVTRSWNSYIVTSPVISP